MGKDERPELDGEIDKAGVQIVHIAAIRVATRGWVVTAALRRVALFSRKKRTESLNVSACGNFLLGHNAVSLQFQGRMELAGIIRVA